MVPLDLVGNVSLVLQVVILFLLILGLPFVKGLGVKKNLLKHGYLTILALITHSVLIFIVMIPVFSSSIGDFSERPEIATNSTSARVTLLLQGMNDEKAFRQGPDQVGGGYSRTTHCDRPVRRGRNAADRAEFGRQPGRWQKCPARSGQGSVWQRADFHGAQERDQDPAQERVEHA